MKLPSHLRALNPDLRETVRSGRGGRSKYGARKTLRYGVLFDSVLEADRYMFLRSLADAGTITDLETQVQFVCKVNRKKVCSYFLDFRYQMRGGATIHEDAKGYATREFRLKKKLVEALFGIEIVEVRTATQDIGA